MSRPFFIGIAGESGVGKSTIAEIVKLYLNEDDVLHLSTDDLHKWERTNLKWDSFTHLNPEANNLELGDMQISDLADGKPIYRSVYNHFTGYFDPPLRMGPKKYVINEGLHAFYTDEMKRLIDLKIFVDTDELLRTHWKIIRDTEQRGYKYNAVINAISRRQRDSLHAREKQIVDADAIIRITSVGSIRIVGCKNEKVVLFVEYDCKDEAWKPMLDFIKNILLGLDSPGITPVGRIP